MHTLQKTCDYIIEIAKNLGAREAHTLSLMNKRNRECLSKADRRLCHLSTQEGGLCGTGRMLPLCSDYCSGQTFREMNFQSFWKYMKRPSAPLFARYAAATLYDYLAARTLAPPLPPKQKKRKREPRTNEKPKLKMYKKQRHESRGQAENHLRSRLQAAKELNLDPFSSDAKDKADINQLYQRKARETALRQFRGTDEIFGASSSDLTATPTTLLIQWVDAKTQQHISVQLEKTALSWDAAGDHIADPLLPSNRTRAIDLLTKAILDAAAVSSPIAHISLIFMWPGSTAADKPRRQESWYINLSPTHELSVIDQGPPHGLMWQQESGKWPEDGADDDIDV
jgi:hypothetical protein